MRRFPSFAALVLGASLVAGSALADGEHVVERGQTLTAIARRYRVTVEQIREANHLLVWQQLKPGQTLLIPGAEPSKGGREKAVLASTHHGAVASRGAPDFGRRPARPGTVHMVRGDERFDGQLVGRHGKVNPTALAGLGKILRFYPTGARASIDARLAALIAQVSDHFGGRTIHIVSGFRPFSPKQYTPHSNHNHGRAMDFSVEGVPNTVLRDYCHQFRDAGVGYYPNSTFVHLDVRSGKASWTDYAGPGERPRYEKPGPHPEADESADDVELAGGGSHTPDAPVGLNPTQ